MKHLLFFLLPLSLAAQTPDPCTGGDCYCIYQSALQVWKAKQYELAINKLNAWKTCDPERTEAADRLVIEVFREIEKLKTDAEQATRTAYANDLAYKSEIALKDGDRNTSFRLAEFAHRYVDSTNTNVVRALVEALYYNDNPKHSPLPRVTNHEGHAASVWSVAFSPDGQRLATGSFDNSAKIWDLDSGKALTTLEGHTSYVGSVDFSPDGKRLATGSTDKSAKIWMLQPDTLIQHWQRKKQADLLLPQLQQYNLDALLDQQPSNEAALIATKEVWQITAFADLYAQQAAGSNILARVEPLYARAARLYAAALQLQEEGYIRQKYRAMLGNWAKVYRENGMEGKAAEVEGKLH